MLNMHKHYLSTTTFMFVSTCFDMQTYIQTNITCIRLHTCIQTTHTFTHKKNQSHKRMRTCHLLAAQRRSIHRYRHSYIEDTAVHTHACMHTYVSFTTQQVAAAAQAVTLTLILTPTLTLTLTLTVTLTLTLTLT